MKIRLSKEQIDNILDDPEKAQETGVKINDPWWLVVLKVISYILGLILAGGVTTSCVSSFVG